MAKTDREHVVSDSTPALLHRPDSIRLLCCIGVVLLALLQLISKYMFMDPDGLSYLDISDAYLRGDWHNAINAYWSPLFSWMLAVATALVRPSPYWEFTLVHFVNFGVLIVVLFSFSFLIRQIDLYQEFLLPDDATTHHANRIPWRLEMLVRYTILLWVSVDLITVVRPTPDMSVMVIVFLAAGLTLRICRRVAGRNTWIMLGVVLGFGYLAKTAMLPIGISFLLVIMLTKRAARWRWRNFILASLMFFLIVAPFVALISFAKHRFTIGDSGRLNYSWAVNKNTRWLHWQGEVSGSGTPIHPTRKILDHPVMYEFAVPISGTFPPWYDPTYWYEGVRVYFDFGQQLTAIKSNAERLVAIFVHSVASKLLAALLLLWLTMSYRHFIVREIARYWMLLAPAVLATTMYALVIVIPRYVAPFLAIMLVVLLKGVRWPRHTGARKILEPATLALVVSILVATAWTPVARSIENFILLARHEEPHRHWQIANYLSSIGIKPGDKVASVGYSFLPAWSRLARTRVVSEMPSADLFWLTPSAALEVTQVFAQSGAKVVIATPVLIREDPDIPLDESQIPPELLKSTPPPTGWRRIENMDVYIYVLR
jgi:hypothetical protein